MSTIKLYNRPSQETLRLVVRTKSIPSVSYPPKYTGSGLSQSVQCHMTFQKTVSGKHNRESTVCEFESKKDDDSHVYVSKMFRGVSVLESEVTESVEFVNDVVTDECTSRG